MTTEHTHQHTPGPWEWIGNGLTEQHLVRQGFAVGEGDDVLYHGGDWSMKEANARLIAAAPELLEALQGVLNSDMAQREEDEGRISPVLVDVRTAIAKATGQPA